MVMATMSVSKVTDFGEKSGWLNFWRISVLGVLLALAMWVNHVERVEHNKQAHILMMRISECNDAK